MSDPRNVVAPEGYVFVCMACGKRSHDKYGEQAISYGFDVACVLHAVLCREDSLVFGEHGLVKEAVAMVESP
jgi:hypothetical protein